MTIDPRRGKERCCIGLFVEWPVRLILGHLSLARIWEQGWPSCQSHQKLLGCEMQEHGRIGSTGGRHV